MQSRYLIAIVAILAGLLLWLLFAWQPASELGKDARVSAEPKGGDFILQGPRGPVGLEDFRGKVVMLYFGYTWCPDICPTNLALFSSVLNEMSDSELEMVQPVFVSVDPARDTIERLLDYCQYFHEKLIGLTGSDDAVAAAAARYGVAYRAVEPDKYENYAVDHSADTYLLNKQGKLAKRLPHGTSAEILLAEIRALL